MLLTLPADSRSAPRASTSDDECAALGQRAASGLAAGLSTEARLSAGSAHAECLRAHQDHVGVAEALGRMVSDVGLKAAHPLAVVHASNQVAELAMAGHIEWQQAERVFRELHSGWAGNAASLRSHGLVCTQTGAMERAMDLFEASVRLHPDDYTHSQAVITCQRLSRHDDALRHAQAALRLNPRPEYDLDVGSALVKLGRYREARHHLTVATTKLQDHPGASIEMGLCLMGLGDHAAAPTWLERGAALGGGDFRVWLMAAAQHVKGGKHSAARRCYARAIKACRAASKGAAEKRGQRGEEGGGGACVLAEGRAMEHRQRFCDWGKWQAYMKLEPVLLARSSDERVLTPFQVGRRSVRCVCA